MALRNPQGVTNIKAHCCPLKGLTEAVLSPVTLNRAASRTHRVHWGYPFCNTDHQTTTEITFKLLQNTLIQDNSSSVSFCTEPLLLVQRTNELLPDLSDFDDFSFAVCTTFPKRAMETNCEQHLFNLFHIIPYMYVFPRILQISK